jgi:hypothetical protein
MTSDDRLLLILRRLDEIERKLDRSLRADAPRIFSDGPVRRIGIHKDAINRGG